MPPRKRTRAQAEAEESEGTSELSNDPAVSGTSEDGPPPAKKEKRNNGDTKEMSLLQRIRNMWEFASLMQYIYLFGKVVKIEESFDVEDLEAECLKPGPSEKLAEIGLSLLKFVSSHRGLTPELFDEYTRRQYVAKAPTRNPYGTEEEPNKFAEFDVFLKLRVLHQLSVWTLHNPDRIRERMGESDETQWRMEELGYDRHERLYFVLDDNRLYRRTNPPLPSSEPAKPKKNTKKAQAAARRASKRQRVIEPEPDRSDVLDPEKKEIDENEPKQQDEQLKDTFGGMRWECLAITHEEYQEFLETLKKTRDPDEKILRDRLVDDVMPIIEKLEEDQRKKALQKEKELLNLQKLASAKRSSRLADKQEKAKQEQEALEAKRKYEADLAQAIKDQARKAKMEQDRQSRMETREQRIRDREQKRLLRERELQMIAEKEKELENGETRASERRLKSQLAKTKEDLEELEQEEDWTFDCSGCGIYGKNADDGSHSIACEKCNVWQHSKCLGISPVTAEKDDFHFTCKDCKRKEEDEKIRKIKRIKFNMGSSSSPPDKSHSVNGSPAESRKRKSVDDPNHSPTKKVFKYAQVPPPPPNFQPQATAPPPNMDLMNGTRPVQQPPVANFTNGPRLSPRGEPLPPPNHPHAYQNGLYGHSPTKSSPKPHEHSPTMNGRSQHSYYQGSRDQALLMQPPYPPQANGSLERHQNPHSHTISHAYIPDTLSARPPQSGYFSFPTPSTGQSGASPPGSSQVPGQGGPFVRPSSSQGPSPYSRPPLSGPAAPAATADARTLPSPIQNRPSMSPSQGRHNINMGLSPTKQSPPPGGAPPLFSSPPRTMNTGGGASIGGTPVMPPIKNLAPSPKPPTFNPLVAPSSSPNKSFSPQVLPALKQHLNGNGNTPTDRL